MFTFVHSVDWLHQILTTLQVHPRDWVEMLHGRLQLNRLSMKKRHNNIP